MIPFVDRQRLIDAVAGVLADSKLTEAETALNTLKAARIFRRHGGSSALNVAPAGSGLRSNDVKCAMRPFKPWPYVLLVL